MKYIISILLPILLFLTSSCIPNDSQTKTPQADMGVMDLREWNPEDSPLVPLRGTWKIKILHPIALDDRLLIEVPGTWNATMNKLGSGMAIYYLSIKLPNNPDYRKNLALEMNDISSAFELKLNGELVLSKGVVGSSREEMKPSYKRPIIFLNNLEEELNLEIKVSNYYHPKGGIRSSIILGKTSGIIDKNSKRLAIMWLLVGATFIMGIYHIIIFSMRRIDQSSLWFGLFSVQVGLRAFFDNNVFFYRVFPDEYWVLIHKIDVISFAMTLPLFSLFIHSVFSKEFHKTILKIFISVGIIYTFIIAFSISNFYMNILNYFEVFIIVAILYFLFIIFKTVGNKREGSILFLFGSLILFSTVINDILNQMRLIQTGYIVNFGFIAFLLSQTTLLSRRYTLAFVHLEELKTSLEDKVQSRTKELNNAKQNAESANHLKDKFLSLVSHDLRSPIASVIGLLNLIIEDYNEITDNEKKTYLQKALDNLNHSLGMISQLLKMNRLRTGSIVLENEEFDVYIEIENITNKFWMQANQKKIKIINLIPIGLYINTDKSLLGEIFFNLISNAIKFSNIGGEIYISYNKDEEGKFIEFTVQDSGIGIEPTVMENMFKSDVKTTQKGTMGEVGTGLGLPFVKDILDQLNGVIHVKSEPYSGSSFTFRLPVAQSSTLKLN
ncbi:MAG: sensor histidine kinase [Leptospira sp.]|nr:sensor histidine kinase [Leptospira sp.]